MHNLDEANAKMKYENARTAVNQDCCTNAQIGQMAATRERTRSEQLNADADAHRRQASVSQRAANFFAAHPEFEEFMKLREEGAIYF